MKRTNAFVLASTREQEGPLHKVALGCAKLWNEVNYQRRQTYINYKGIGWYPKELYQKYAPLIGSATAQQIINKNNEAWRSFLALKKLEKEGKIPSQIKSVKPPRYWKDKEGKYRLMIILRNDCYRLKDGVMKLPKGLEVPFRGKMKWVGKQCRAEILYDDLDWRWRVFQTVETRSFLKPLGSKTCHIDLGIINLATIWVEGWRQPVAYNGRNLLSDWWYWTRRIAKYQRRLKRVNGKHASRRLRKLYRVRLRRFRHAVNAMARNIMRNLYKLGVSKIVVGNLKHIRDDNGNNGAKTNSMIHNFWSFNHIIQRIKDVAEEYGIKVNEVSEYKTSTRCIRCGSENIINNGRFFKCSECGLEAHRDAVGVLNIGSRRGENVNGVMAYPLLLRWKGMRWEAKMSMNNQLMKTLEARISQASAVGVSTKPSGLSFQIFD